jgi:Fungal trichothecene efflux pump (TRI12)
MVLMKRDNIWLSYILLIISGLGVGGIVVPASIITAIICPDELIATVTALTIAIRVLGGAIGYAIYYNVFLSHFKTNAQNEIVPILAAVGVKDPTAIVGIIDLTGAGLINVIRTLPGMTDPLWEALVAAGQEAYAKSYPFVYYVSIAFGCAATIASLFLTNIDHYMTDHIAVKYDGESSEVASANEKAAEGHGVTT